MSPIRLAREMRRLGWSYARRRRGEATFGIRFPNGRGVTRVLALEAVADATLDERCMAKFMTGEAASAAGHVLRASAG